MLKAFLRVAARSVTIQLEEAAAAHQSTNRGSSGSNKSTASASASASTEAGETKSTGYELSSRFQAETKDDLTDSRMTPASNPPSTVHSSVTDQPVLPSSQPFVFPPIPTLFFSRLPVKLYEPDLPAASSTSSPPSGPVIVAPSVTKSAVSEMEVTEVVSSNPTESVLTSQQATLESPIPSSSAEELSQVTLRPSKVPSSQLGRLFHYGSLFAGMGMGAASEYVRRSTGKSGSGSVFMSEANVRRLVDKLSKMRGAALKLGQFMSIQDTNMLPEQLEKVLQQVQANADYMPEWQLDRVMTSQLGSGWESNFETFDKIPMASASIGQVHRATLSSSHPTNPNLAVAVKVQFPGIHSSIISDLDNLSLLLKTSALLPRGLYLDNTINVMRGELADECDYVKEAESGRRFKRYLEEREEPFFEVPKVIDELSTAQVLTTEMMCGKPLSVIKDFDQGMRNKIGTAILRLCLLELFQFRLMQTDPNWANFLYDRKKENLQLIDFGATREYSVEFMDKWYRLLKSVIDNDRVSMEKYSRAVGYLTGEEKKEMLEAHLRSMELLAGPFLEDEYDFGKQSVTNEVRTLIPTMLRHRLTPPPNETYSLNRKLSGSFLLCAKLGSKVRCKALWEEVVGDYKPTTIEK